jgi:hypothetical protein
MKLLTEDVLRFVGVESLVVTAPEPVERGAVRRYAQAIMDEDAMFAPGGPEAAVAPMLFSSHMFRRPFGSEDPLVANAHDPDFDGAVGSAIRGLPELPLRGLTRLNGGSEIECYRYARHGETIRMQSRYVDIKERDSSKGPMILAVVETRYLGDDDATVLVVRNTAIYR